VDVIQQSIQNYSMKKRGLDNSLGNKQCLSIWFDDPRWKIAVKHHFSKINNTKSSTDVVKEKIPRIVQLRRSYQEILLAVASLECFCSKCWKKFSCPIEKHLQKCEGGIIYGARNDLVEGQPYTLQALQKSFLQIQNQKCGGFILEGSKKTGAAVIQITPWRNQNKIFPTFLSSSAISSSPNEVYKSNNCLIEFVSQGGFLKAPKKYIHSLPKTNSPLNSSSFQDKDPTYQDYLKVIFENSVDNSTNFIDNDQLSHVNQYLMAYNQDLSQTILLKNLAHNIPIIIIWRPNVSKDEYFYIGPMIICNMFLIQNPETFMWKLWVFRAISIHRYIEFTQLGRKLSNFDNMPPFFNDIQKPNQNYDSESDFESYGSNDE